MKVVLAVERPYKQMRVVTETGTVLVSEGGKIKIITMNEDTGEENELQGVVMMLSAKKMEILPVDYAYVSIVEFGDIREIEVV